MKATLSMPTSSGDAFLVSMGAGRANTVLPRDMRERRIARVTFVVMSRAGQVESVQEGCVVLDWVMS